MKITARKLKMIARRIASDLMTEGGPNSIKVRRLALVTSEHAFAKDLSGLCEGAIVDRIAEHLQRELIK